MNPPPFPPDAALEDQGCPLLASRESPLTLFLENRGRESGPHGLLNCQGRCPDNTLSCCDWVQNERTLNTSGL